MSLQQGFMLPTHESSTGNFLRGFSSALDLYPRIDFLERIASKSHGNVDANALSDDWKRIGQDLEKSLKKYDDSSE